MKMPPALRSVDFLKTALLSPSGDWEAGYASAEIVGNRSAVSCTAENASAQASLSS
jgi:hypothetical protein